MTTEGIIRNTISEGEPTPQNTNEALVRTHFAAAADAALSAGESMARDIVRAAQRVTDAFLNNHKLCVFGANASGADAAYFVARLNGALEQARPALPAIHIHRDAALGSGGQDSSAAARQIRAVGNPNDVLLILCSDDDSRDIAAVIEAARERDMRLVLQGRSEVIRSIPTPTSSDATIIFTEQRIIRTLELQRIAIHALCDVIDSLLLGDG